MAGTTLIAQTGGASASVAHLPIVQRHATTSPRTGANRRPRSQLDQGIVSGWPMYRTPRGQSAFNRAMATLAATQTQGPGADQFAGCADLKCRLTLPAFDSKGWFPEGRLWTSPRSYIVFVRSPRGPRRGSSYRRLSSKAMRYFVFHEFHNSTGNTDVYDTVSAHRRSVFVPFYLSKSRRDIFGRTFVTLVQTAPWNVRSRHAANFRNQGSGVEVAKNVRDKLEPLQATAGILLAQMVLNKKSNVKVVRHRGSEGRPMLRAFQAWRKGRSSRRLRVPFTKANAKAIAAASVDFNQLVLKPGATPAEAAARLAARPFRLLPKPAAGAVRTAAVRRSDTASARRPPARAGSAGQRPAQRPAPTLNGPALNGPALNRPGLNRPALNGPVLNGPALLPANVRRPANRGAQQAPRRIASRTPARDRRIAAPAWQAPARTLTGDTGRSAAMLIMAPTLVSTGELRIRETDVLSPAAAAKRSSANGQGRTARVTDTATRANMRDTIGQLINQLSQ
ncbi:MAG: hypothetical protein AAFO79_02640 [Pseudomonadota bacterium]